MSREEKLRQMASASVRAYLGGAETLPARRDLVVHYLNTVPLRTAWPREVPLSASCTLKRLQYYYWDPYASASLNLMRDAMNGAKGSREGATGRMIMSLLTEVPRWPAENIHLGGIPPDWFQLAVAIKEQLLEWSDDAIEGVQEYIDSLGDGAIIQGTVTERLRQTLGLDDDSLLGNIDLGDLTSVGPVNLTAGNFGGENLTQAQVTVAVDRLPAKSSPTPEITRPTPAAALTGAGQVRTPESASEQAKVTVTSPRCQPSGPGGGETAAVTRGGVLSRFKETVVVDTWPARSTASPATDWSAPSDEILWGSVQLRMPTSSAQVKVTVASVRCQPASLAGGATAPVMVGGVPSTFNVTVAVEKLPAKSSPAPDTTCAAPAARATGAGQVFTPDRVSEQAKATVTASRCQPSGPGGGDIVVVTTGGVLSTLTETLAEVRLPALSAAVRVIPWAAPSVGTVTARGSGLVRSPGDVY